MCPNMVIYGFVARGPVVLVGRTSLSIQRQFNPIVVDCLQTLATEDIDDEKKLGYKADDHDFLFFKKNGYIYSVLVYNQHADFRIKQEKLFVFLRSVMEEFSRRFGAGEGGLADTAGEYGLEEAFGSRLRLLIATFHAENTILTADDKLSKIYPQRNSKEDETFMLKNVDRVTSMDYNERIDVIVEKPGDVHSEPESDGPPGGQLWPKRLWHKYRTIFIIIFLVFVVFLIIFYASCGGIKCLT